MPKTFESYIGLHTGNNKGADREDRISNLAKAMAADFLLRTRAKFDVKAIRSLALNIRKTYELDKLEDAALEEALANRDAVFKSGEKRAYELYRINGGATYKDFIRAEMKKSCAVTPDYRYNTMLTEVSQFANAIGYAYSLLKGTPAADIVRDINHKIHD